MNEALIKMLNQCVGNLESAHYWLEGKDNVNSNEAQKTLSVAEDLIRNAIEQLKGA